MLRRIAMLSVAALVWAVGLGASELAGVTWEGALEKKVRSSKRLLRLGGELYLEVCAQCHGESGDGQGPGERNLFTKPRVFTDGKYKIRTTPTGSLPTDEDLFRTITVGFPAYGMPRFGYLSAKERWALVYYLKSLSPRFDEEMPDPQIEIGPRPARPASMAAGRQVYQAMGCGRCHGEQGKGDGPSAAGLMDSWDRPARVLDLTWGERAFKRGAGARDIVYTFMTGVNGTPMPSFAETMSMQDAWSLAFYIEEMAQVGSD